MPAPPMIPLADCLYCPLLTEKGEGGGSTAMSDSCIWLRSGPETL